MGYHTDFEGRFEFNQSLIVEHRLYLQKFNRTRRMKRNEIDTELVDDKIREDVGLPVGKEGAYFVGGGGDFGQDHENTVISYNDPPEGQPGLWCQWTADDGGDFLEWDGGDKFYDYVEWLEYLIKNFIGPWGYKLNGKVSWKGEGLGDAGIITLENNALDVQGVY